jgi:opacity protein-like surface antigen
MKSNNLIVLALSLSFASAYAQSGQVLNSDAIDVDGYLHERPVTDGELEQIKNEIRKQKNDVVLNKEKTKGFKELTKTTEKLSETTEEYIDEKKSAQKEIAEYNAKIKCLMEENPGKDCDKYVRNRRREEVKQEVSVAQAAPVATSQSSVSAETLSGQPFETIKLIPYAGGTQYNGKIEQLEAEFAGGIRLESNITTRFSMGIGLNITQLKTQDFANNMFANQGWMPQYNNMFGAREIQYRSFGLDLYGKFFLTNGERFRPYVGAGLGYNRSSMRYTQNDVNNIMWNGQNNFFGNEEFRASFANATLMAGSEVMITRSFGLNIEAAYSTGLGNAMNSQNARNPMTSPDQVRLRELGQEIINANALSIFAGAVIVF